ncbi:MAG TPA: DUF1223 domain-containing protein [Longibacter sp.]
MGFLLLCGLLVLATRPAPPEANAVESSAVAVVELFSSDTCLTCTPADSLLGHLLDEARRHDRAVYALDFHVDYKQASDATQREAQRRFVERQRAYARHLGDHVYTPQMVVNGTHAFVGSDDYRARRSIGAVLRQQAPVQLDARATLRSDRSILVDVGAAGTHADASLNVALLADAPGSASSHHRNQVRSFATVPLEEEMVVRLDVPDGLSLSEARVIVYAQDATTLAVIGATRAAIE